jgi:mRNA interferase YafQ
LKSIFWTNQFKKDYKRAQKQKKDIKALKDVLVLLADGQKLPPRYKDHSLQGDWSHYRDCHIKPDWVLIYKIDGDSLILVRMGSHSELFKSHSS